MSATLWCQYIFNNHSTSSSYKAYERNSGALRKVCAGSKGKVDINAMWLAIIFMSFNYFAFNWAEYWLRWVGKRKEDCWKIAINTLLHITLWIPISGGIVYSFPLHSFSSYLCWCIILVNCDDVVDDAHQWL